MIDVVAYLTGSYESCLLTRKAPFHFLSKGSPVRIRPLRPHIT